MINLRRSYEYSTVYGLKNVPKDIVINPKNKFFGRGNGTSTPNCVFLKKDAEFIPLPLVVNNPSAAIEISKSQFASNISNIATQALVHPGITSPSGKTAFDILQSIGDSAEVVYDDIQRLSYNSFSRAIPLSINITSNNMMMNGAASAFTNYHQKDHFISAGGNHLIYPFYIVENDKILFSLMVKRDYLYDFNVNFNEGFYIDPKHVEFWVDKHFLLNGVSYKFFKWLKDEFLVSLMFKGFTILEKEDILSELIYRQTVNFKSAQEFFNFKTNVNNFLIDC